MPEQANPPSGTERPVDPGVRIGHVHLKVADLDRALGFYCGVLGFELTQRYGHGAAGSLRRAATTIISVSTPGKAWAARPRRQVQQEATSTTPSCTRRAPLSPTLCAA